LRPAAGTCGTLPLGLSLALAGLIASLYGERIVAWYVGFYVV
jgi:hypothetical protein